MSEILDLAIAALKERDQVSCPHCRSTIDMTDCERLQGHVTYWGDDGPKTLFCGECNTVIYLKEHVSRWWTVGRTPEEAEDL